MSLFERRDEIEEMSKAKKKDEMRRRKRLNTISPLLNG
jgi:hypothetical protein